LIEYLFSYFLKLLTEELNIITTIIYIVLKLLHAMLF